MVEQTANQFYKSAKIDQKHLDWDLVERKEFKPIFLTINQAENRYSMNINWTFSHVQLINIPI